MLDGSLKLHGEGDGSDLGAYCYWQSLFFDAVNTQAGASWGKLTEKKKEEKKTMMYLFERFCIVSGPCRRGFQGTVN